MQSVLKCRLFEVFRASIRGRDGREHDYEIIRHPGAVVILPLLADGRCVMIRNHRLAIDRELWELPAGVIEPGEPPEQTARRELEEETGYQAASMRPLIAFYSSPGIMDELLRAFVATDLTRATQRLEPTERIRVEPLTWSEIVAMICDGRIVDAKTIVTLLRWNLERSQPR